jgi:hypothetical protein
MKKVLSGVMTLVKIMLKTRIFPYLGKEWEKRGVEIREKEKLYKEKIKH